MSDKKRFAVVGTGGRSGMFTKAVIEDFADHCELVAACDINPGRLQYKISTYAEKGVDVMGYAPEDFDRMVKEQKVDTVIVTTKDCMHDEYICRAMELGCDAITEKPMTTDETKCQRIVDTQKKTGRSCRVTFNYRYSPPRTQIKELLMDGVIGNIISIDFNWLLNTRHGADYYRRWHRNKENSGGLLVHKATHHFDLVNWWLSSVPEEVHAIGSRQFYTPETGDRYGFTNRGERCLDCPEFDKCPFRLDLKKNKGHRKLYLENEQHDGYFRDRCVFSRDIDIEDNMNLTVKYRNGTRMSYSLNSFLPWEGLIISLNGTKGRLEHICQETVYVNGDGSVPGELIPEGTKTKIYPHFQCAYEVEIRTGKGGHGGGDPALLNDIFGLNPPEDRTLRAADHRGGSWSILTGVAGNRSIETGKTVKISDLVTGLDEPDYPAMPTGNEPIDPKPMMDWLDQKT